MRPPPGLSVPIVSVLDDDGELIESVLIPSKKRMTLCISSQAGCAIGCTFCATGWGGFDRQLTAGEIVC